LATPRKGAEPWGNTFTKVLAKVSGVIEGRDSFQQIGCKETSGRDSIALGFLGKRTPNRLKLSCGLCEVSSLYLSPVPVLPP
jgi:hypothetical protein